MAYSSAKHLSLFFFFIALLFSGSSQVEAARESRFFFSKVTRFIGTVNKAITEVPTLAPALEPALAPTPAPEISESAVPVPAPAPATSFGAETESGYGLYGTQETPMTPATDIKNEMLTEELGGGEEDFENRYGKSNYNVDSTDKGNNYYGNYNGYESERSGSREQQGMSDTRFLENGKYYHDVKNDQNDNDHENKYYNYNGYDQTAERGPRYVFDSMEEYEKYQESQGN